MQWRPAQRHQLAKGLANGKIALVRVDTFKNAGQAGARYVTLDIGDNGITGTVIGPARTGASRLQSTGSTGLLVEVSGPKPVLLSTGLTLAAHIATKTQQDGVMVPASAPVEYEGARWIYIRRGGGLERRLLQDTAPGSGGLFVVRGLAPGEQVVSRGAGAQAEASSQPAKLHLGTLVFTDYGID